MKELWVEKYRPKTVDGYVFRDEHQKSQVKQWIKEGKMDGFNIGQNRGKAAGQSIFWPHIHFIPRKDNDYKGKGHNGVRLSIPSGDHTNYY